MAIIDGKISSLNPLPSGLTGQEWVEVSKRDQNGNWSSFRFSLGDIELTPGEKGDKGDAGESAYQIAVAQGYSGSEAEWLASLEGKSIYALAVELGFTGTEEEYLVSLKGERGEDGKSAYTVAVENGYEGTEVEFAEMLMGGPGVNGGVFITNVVPTGAGQNTGEFVYSDGIALTQCSSTTEAVRVSVSAFAGHSHFVPGVTVNGVIVNFTADANTTLFKATVDVIVGDDGLITATHEDGAEWVTEVVRDVPPVITEARFTSAYPGEQTELKLNDVMSISITTDVDVVGYEIANQGAFKAASGSLTAGTEHSLTGLQIADRGTSTAAHGFRVRVRKANGAWSEWYNTGDAGSTELEHVVNLNNLYPSIGFGGIVYPSGKTALGSADQGQVNCTVTNMDEVEYTSTQLTINEPTVYAQQKTVSWLSGDYNVSVNNFLVRATRAANGAVTNGGVIVAISTVAPVITISTPHARLRSGGNAGTTAQLHTITLTSTQALRRPPTLNAPEGTWADAEFTASAGNTVWTRRLRVHDDNAKGTFQWNSLVAESRSGEVVNTISGGEDYVLGGFVFRSIYVSPFPNREMDIGTEVVNTAKLRCTNTSKGPSGSLNFGYQGSLDNRVDTYTITGPSGVFNPNGNLWYNLDGANASSNTGGTMLIEIEEVI